jgi:predicted kinase
MAVIIDDVEVVIFIGLQASGKSSFFRERFFDTHVRINLDMLRTRHREKLLFEACLAAKQPCVIDNTNPTAADRARYIAAARAAGARVVGYCFRSRLEECQARNLSRPGTQAIPAGALRSTHARLEPPRREEGFDELKYVHLEPEAGFVVEEWRYAAWGTAVR